MCRGLRGRGEALIAVEELVQNPEVGLRGPSVYIAVGAEKVEIALFLGLVSPEKQNTLTGP